MTYEPFSRRSFLASDGRRCRHGASFQASRPRCPCGGCDRACSDPLHARGRNNYRPNAPMVDRLGSGFFVRGKVLRAGDGAPLKGLRIQIWAATVLGGEPDPVNHGSVLTRADGSFELEMAQIVPNFGQPHAHLAYDDGAFQTVFLRPVMPSARDTSVSADFVLAPA